MADPARAQDHTQGGPSSRPGPRSRHHGARPARGGRAEGPMRGTLGVSVADTSTVWRPPSARRPQCCTSRVMSSWNCTASSWSTCVRAPSPRHTLPYPDPILAAERQTRPPAPGLLQGSQGSAAGGARLVQHQDARGVRLQHAHAAHLRQAPRRAHHQQRPVQLHSLRLRGSIGYRVDAGARISAPLCRAGARASAPATAHRAGRMARGGQHRMRQLRRACPGVLGGPSAYRCRRCQLSTRTTACPQQGGRPPSRVPTQRPPHTRMSAAPRRRAPGTSPSLRAPRLAVRVGAADALLHAAARVGRQQAVRDAHDLHCQLAAGRADDRLQAARLVRPAVRGERERLCLRALDRQRQHRQHIRQRLPRTRHWSSRMPLLMVGVSLQHTEPRLHVYTHAKSLAFTSSDKGCQTAL